MLFLNLVFALILSITKLAFCSPEGMFQNAEKLYNDSSLIAIDDTDLPLQEIKFQGRCVGRSFTSQQSVYWKSPTDGNLSLRREIIDDPVIGDKYSTVSIYIDPGRIGGTVTQLLSNGDLGWRYTKGGSHIHNSKEVRVRKNLAKNSLWVTWYHYQDYFNNWGNQDIYCYFRMP